MFTDGAIYSREWIKNYIVNTPYFSMMLTDDQSRILFVNDTYLRIMGFRRDDIIGKHVDDVVPMGKTPEVLRTGKAKVGYILPVNGVDTIAASYPIIQDDRVVGVFGISLFLDMELANVFLHRLKFLCKQSSNINKQSHEYARKAYSFETLIGQNAGFKKVKELAKVIAAVDGTVLITGESGTGKDLFAKAIHAISPRGEGPFIRLNCAAIPENLIESELFGYDEGTFTGGIRGGKKGKFEVADTGTIFLDEIGELPLNMQAKLLNVLQEKEIEPLGSLNKMPKKIDVRVIAATNRDLEKMVMAGEFRHDLYYRLNVITIEVPPLRQRKDDISLLADWIIRKINERNHIGIYEIDPQAHKILYDYNWPGNVRELENVIERALIRAKMAGCTMIAPKHISELFYNTSKLGFQSEASASTDLRECVQKTEKKLIMEVLNRTNGDKTLSAEMLGIHISALYKKMRKYDLSLP